VWFSTPLKSRFFLAHVVPQVHASRRKVLVAHVRIVPSMSSHPKLHLSPGDLFFFFFFICFAFAFAFLTNFHMFLSCCCHLLPAKNLLFFNRNRENGQEVVRNMNESEPG
jgi:hypothetical protein